MNGAITGFVDAYEQASEKKKSDWRLSSRFRVGKNISWNWFIISILTHNFHCITEIYFQLYP